MNCCLAANEEFALDNRFGALKEVASMQYSHGPNGSQEMHIDARTKSFLRNVISEERKFIGKLTVGS